MTQKGSNYLRSGFVLALSLRMLTASLAIVVPLYATSVLGSAPAGAGFFVVLLWVGNAVGVGLATLAIRNQSVSSVAGFTILGLSLLALAVRPAGLPTWTGVFVAGIGMGLPQPFLSGLMHLGSGKGRSFSGLGFYSAALSLGLVLGPLLSYGALEGHGFAGVLVALSLVCALGVGTAVWGHGGTSGSGRLPRPSPKDWLQEMRNGQFRSALYVNFLYSMLLPLFLSYGAIYAETRFGFTPESALILFTVLFSLSTLSRVLAIRLQGGLQKVLLASVGVLLASALCLALAPSWEVFTAGMILFSIPHAMVYPIANYLAFTFVEEADVMNASYLFQASSGVAELASPALAVLLILFLGLQGVFFASVVFAVGVLISATKISMHRG